MHHHFCKQFFLLLFFPNFFGGKLGNTWFFPNVKMLIFIFQQRLATFRNLKIWRKKRKKTLLLKRMVIVIRIQKHMVHLSSCTWVLPFCSLYFPFLGCFGEFIWWAGFHQKHWSLKNKSKPETLNPKPGCFGEYIWWAGFHQKTLKSEEQKQTLSSKF
jgi:hypothetical protein